MFDATHSDAPTARTAFDHNRVARLSATFTTAYEIARAITAAVLTREPGQTVVLVDLDGYDAAQIARVALTIGPGGQRVTPGETWAARAVGCVVELRLVAELERLTFPGVTVVVERSAA